MKNNKKEMVKRLISRRFVCEHCGNISKWKNTTVMGETQEIILNKKIPAAQKNVAKNDYSDFAGDGKCAKCGKRQSWEIKGSTFFMKWSLPIGLGAAGSLGWVIWLMFGLLGFAAVFVVVSLLAFIFGLVEYIKIRTNMRATNKRNKPEIIWEGVELNTEPAAVNS
jgi:hypothetical protein